MTPPPNTTPDDPFLPRCFVGPCTSPPTWLITGVQGGGRSTVPSCHVHLLDILIGQQVRVELARPIAQQRAHSVESYFP